MQPIKANAASHGAPLPLNVASRHRIPSPSFLLVPSVLHNLSIICSRSRSRSSTRTPTNRMQLQSPLLHPSLASIGPSLASTDPSPPRQRRFLPHLQPRNLLRMLGSTLTAVRYLPIFTPHQTLSRWRSRRAMRVAAQQARHPHHSRKWTKRFRLNGLTWHHLYIAQDLRKIHLFLRELHTRLITNPNHPHVSSALVPLERSYSYLMDNVWDVYNTLERQVFFPWVEGGVSDKSAVAKALSLFSKERNRIEDGADSVQSRFSRLVCSTGYPFTSQGPCSTPYLLNATRARKIKRRGEAEAVRARAEALTGVVKSETEARSKKDTLQLREGYRPEEGKMVMPVSLRRVNADEVRQIAQEVGSLIEDTERLHKMERGLLYPLIANTFAEKEQARLTNVMVYSMRSVLAKFMITIYHQAVEKQASRTQWKWYKREVPLPVRVYTPVWRKRLFDGSPLGWLRTTSVRELGR